MTLIVWVSLDDHDTPEKLEFDVNGHTFSHHRVGLADLRSSEINSYDNVWTVRLGHDGALAAGDEPLEQRRTTGDWLDRIEQLKDLLHIGLLEM